MPKTDAAERLPAEPLLPRISLSWLIGLVTLCAIAMGIFQRAVVTGSTWSVLSSVAIAAVVVPILLYIGTFSVASLFSTVGSAAVTLEKPAPIYRPTTEMPKLRQAPLNQESQRAGSDDDSRDGLADDQAAGRSGATETGDAE